MKKNRLTAVLYYIAAVAGYIAAIVSFIYRKKQYWSWYDVDVPGICNAVSGFCIYDERK